MKPYLLGIDIGTSACKVALHAVDGSVVCQMNHPYKTYTDKPGYAEQNPNDWWQAVCRATSAMLDASGIAPADIAGIGIDGQSWSAIPIDKAGKVLANTPIWTDTRAQDICETLRRDMGEEALFAVSGNPIAPTYSLPKMLWFQWHAPELYAKTAHFLQSNSFIGYRLTGVISQDISQGYGLFCFDMRRGVYDTSLCRALGIAPSLLPDIYACDAIIGHVTDAAARETGLAAGTPVVAGGLDAACGTLGAGVIHAGQTQEQGGQAGGMSICLDAYAADKRLILSRHVVPGRYLLQGGTVGGGGMLRWMRETICPECSFEEMSDMAAQVPPGSEGLLMLPYMAGERSPLWDTGAKGVWLGLDFTKQRPHMIRAAMEGVAYALLHNLEVAEAAGATLGVLRAMGGAANSHVWTQIKADVTGKRIEVAASDTATTLGAAMLAGVGTGVYQDYEEAVQKTVHIMRAHAPDETVHAQYRKGYETYRALYESTRELL